MFQNKTTAMRRIILCDSPTSISKKLPWLHKAAQFYADYKQSKNIEGFRHNTFFFLPVLANARFIFQGLGYIFHKIVISIIPIHIPTSYLRNLLKITKDKPFQNFLIIALCSGVWLKHKSKWNCLSMPLMKSQITSSQLYCKI